MDRQRKLESVLNFSMDEADMSFGYVETQKSLRQQFNRLKVNSSTQASMLLEKPSEQRSDYQISLLNFNIDMDSTLSGPISSISVCNAGECGTINNSRNSKKRQRPLKDNNHSRHSDYVHCLHGAKRFKKSEGSSDVSFSTNFGLSFSHSKKRRQEELHQLRVLVEKKHLKLLNLQMAQTRIQMQNEVKLFKKKIERHEMEILRLDKYKG